LLKKSVSLPKGDHLDAIVEVDMSRAGNDDLNDVEKIAMLPRPLTVEDVPDGDDPEIADIGYYAP
jgi:hypothetical protein